VSSNTLSSARTGRHKWGPEKLNRPPELKFGTRKGPRMSAVEALCAKVEELSRAINDLREKPEGNLGGIIME
jgi:hypothetical protein